MISPILTGLYNAPTWYSDYALDTLYWNHEDKYGLFFYYNKTLIYIFKVQRNPSNSSKIHYQINLVNVFKAHHDFITCCKSTSDCHYDSIESFITCGKDKMIRIWSINKENYKQTCVKDLNLGDTKLFTIPVCIETWEKNIIFGCEKGFILTWNYSSKINNFKTFAFDNEDITCMSVKLNQLALGTKRGSIILIQIHNYDNLTKTHKFKGHNSDICCILWTPEDLIDKWGDLSSAGKDRKVKLWQTKDNFNKAILSLPNSRKKLNIEGNNGLSDNSSSWTTICWDEMSSTLIVGSSLGLLGSWYSPEYKDLKYFRGNHHSRSVYGIKVFSSYLPVFISFSMDRNIILSDISSSDEIGNVVVSLPGIGGSVLALAENELNNTIAVGCGDNLLRLWRVDPTIKQNSHDVIVIWDGIMGKISSLAWHPYKEGLLAFGTEDGQVGFVNLNKTDKKYTAINSQKYHSGKVFIVNWGIDLRLCDENSHIKSSYNSMIVYSVGNSSLYGHNFKCENDNFDLTFKLSEASYKITDFSMHKDQQYFLVGYNNGSVKLFSCYDLSKAICSISTHSKGINKLHWCPDNTFKLGIGSVERYLTVTDVSECIRQFQLSLENEENWCELEFNENLAKFIGHGDRITSFSWCCFDVDKIVSVSYDNVAMVWSIKQNGVLASFNSHLGKLYCCVWSSRWENLIFTGGEDGNCFCWDFTHQSIIRQKNTRRPKQNLINESIDNPPEIPVEIAVNTKPEEITQQAVTIKKVIKKRSSLFPTTLFATQHDLETFQRQMKRFLTKSTDDSDVDIDCFKIFTDRRTIENCIQRELAHHLSEKHFDNYFILLIWTSQLGLVTNESMRLDYTPDWLISLIFGNLCYSNLPEVFLDKIVHNILKNNDVILASTYYLIGGHTHKAIQTLLDNKSPREALVLAKLRLSPYDEIFSTKLIPYLKDDFYKNGHFEFSAICSTILGQYNVFVETMERRHNNQNLTGSCIVEVLLYVGKTNEAMKHAFNYLCRQMTEQTFPCKNNEWINKILKHPSFNILSVLVQLYSALWINQNSLIEIMDQYVACASQFSDEWPGLTLLVTEKINSKQLNNDPQRIKLSIVFELLQLFNGGESTKGLIEEYQLLLEDKAMHQLIRYQIQNNTLIEDQEVELSQTYGDCCTNKLSKLIKEINQIIN